MYPVTQTPAAKSKLPSFAWFDYVRPIDKDDIFRWRGKKSGTELRNIPRRSAPLQHISSGTVVSLENGAQSADELQPSRSDGEAKKEDTSETDAGNKPLETAKSESVSDGTEAGGGMEKEQKTAVSENADSEKNSSVKTDNGEKKTE